MRMVWSGSEGSQESIYGRLGRIDDGSSNAGLRLTHCAEGSKEEVGESMFVV
jgi:hypothetical protein